ncbi:MAG TPA: GxxExxY protein [Cyclobacteriaceae bacterium]|nr:GxxExxY protein [Cyclobacteriaceae bacterium]
MTRKQVDKLSYHIIGAAIDVHRRLGPGLLEHVYHTCFASELVEYGFKVSTETGISINFKGQKIASILKCDLLVDDLIVVEVKAVEKIIPLYGAQLLTYMKLLKVPKGILINFNCTNIFKYGQKTFVNEIYSRLPAS